MNDKLGLSHPETMTVLTIDDIVSTMFNIIKLKMVKKRLMILTILAIEELEQSANN